MRKGEIMVKLKTLDREKTSMKTSATATWARYGFTIFSMRQ